jgi:hypothetical protein
MMNSLFGDNANTSFNAPSREQMVMSIWRAVKPIDSTEPAAGAINNPATTDGKWDMWIGFNQTGATGLQGTWNGSRYVANQYRPSANSMMNSLFGNNPNTSFNSVSREKIVMDIWRAVQQPYDSVEPAAGAVTNPAMLKVNVIDPAVISVIWTVDGTMVANSGPTFAVTGLASGSHTITARAYDNAGMDLVRQVPGTTFYRQYWGSGAMGHSDKTVTWTVTIP